LPQKITHFRRRKGANKQQMQQKLFVLTQGIVAIKNRVLKKLKIFIFKNKNLL
jgi:hypothetical protein